MNCSTVRVVDHLVEHHSRIRREADTVPSMKVMPTVELDPDWTTSPFFDVVALFRMIETRCVSRLRCR